VEGHTCGLLRKVEGSLHGFMCVKSTSTNRRSDMSSASRRDSGITIAQEMPVAVANIVIVIGPFAAWAKFGGAVEGEGGHFFRCSCRSAKFLGRGSSPSRRRQMCATMRFSPDADRHADREQDKQPNGHLSHDNLLPMHPCVGSRC
jgi:hypothetical protein